MLHQSCHCSLCQVFICLPSVSVSVWVPEWCCVHRRVKSVFTLVWTAVRDVWRWRLSPVPPSPPSDSNLCSFSDKSQHLVILAWDAGCTMGCSKLCAWSGPGTPHLMGNSLNSAHLSRQCGLGSLFFLITPASQPPPLPPPTYPAATVPGHSPRAIPAHLRPWLMQLSPYLSSCPTVHQARHIQTGPAIC